MVQNNEGNWVVGAQDSHMPGPQVRGPFSSPASEGSWGRSPFELRRSLCSGTIL